MKRIICKAFQCNIWFDGAPAALRIRVFLDDGKVIGVRSMRLMAVDDEGNPCAPIKRYDEGRVEFRDVEFCGEPAPGPYSGT